MGHRESRVEWHLERSALNTLRFRLIAGEPVADGGCTEGDQRVGSKQQGSVSSGGVSEEQGR